MGELIYNIEELDVASNNLIKRIDKAVAAAAFKMRDNARDAFRQSASNYPHSTKKFFELAEGINVGRMKNHEIAVHSFGKKEQYNSYKTRFFVGGTKYRFSKNGASRGYIAANNVVQQSADQTILENFIKNTIQNGQ